MLTGTVCVSSMFKCVSVHLYIYIYIYICVYVCTFEVGSLHTLRLESLKLVFQPLHKFLVIKL